MQLSNDAQEKAYVNFYFNHFAWLKNEKIYIYKKKKIIC